MGQACGTHSRSDKHIQVWVKFVKEIDNLEDLDSDWRKLLREIYRFHSGQVCFPENTGNLWKPNNMSFLIMTMLDGVCWLVSYLVSLDRWVG
jgi:hypothetical protein